MEATAVEMEQPYWAGIDDSLADGIQFVENHAGLTESTKRTPQHPAKKRRRFSRVLDMQIQIPVSLSLPARSFPPPPPTVVDDSQFESAEFWMYPPSHCTLTAPGSPPHSQVVPSI